MDELKTPLCTEVDLVQGYIVLDGVPARRETGTAFPPSFRPLLPILATAVLLSSVVTSDLRHWYIAVGQTESFPVILVDFH